MKLGELVEILKGSFSGERSILDGDYQGLSIDSRRECEGKVFVALKGQNFDAHDFVRDAVDRGAVFCVVERHVDVPHLLVDDTLRALQEIAKAWRLRVDPKVVGITGSSGKTTTKEMVRHALSHLVKCCANRGNENNLVGLPLNLANMPSDTEVFVAEMGTNAFGEIEALSRIVRPDVAAITTIGESHLEGLGDLEGVFREKMGIISSMSGGSLLFCSESPFFEKAKALCSVRGVEVVPLGRKGDFGWFERVGFDAVRFVIDGKALTVRLKVLGEHNAYNALFALSAVSLLGFDWRDAAEALSTFSPAKGRFVVERLGDITLVDDTYNANPLSTKAALRFLSGLEGRKIFVFGSMLELGEESRRLHSEIGSFAHECGIDILIAFGRDAKYAASAFSKSGGQALVFERHEDIVDYLVSSLKSGDNILVKGSRGMRMEKVVEGIRDCFGS